MTRHRSTWTPSASLVGWEGAIVRHRGKKGRVIREQRGDRLLVHWEDDTERSIPRREAVMVGAPAGRVLTPLADEHARRPITARTVLFACTGALLGLVFAVAVMVAIAGNPR